MGPPQTVNGKFSATSLVDKTKDGVSIDACANHCKNEDYMYFGMQYGGACRCSDTYGSKGEDADGCDMICFQDPEGVQKCGGKKRNSVFEIQKDDPDSPNDPALIKSFGITKTCKKTDGQGCGDSGEINLRILTGQTEQSCTDACLTDYECNDFILKTGGLQVGYCYLLRTGLAIICLLKFPNYL